MDRDLRRTHPRGFSETTRPEYRRTIENFALPRWIEFRDELPRSPVGRVLKRELRAEGPAGAWDADTSGITYDKR